MGVVQNRKQDLCVWIDHSFILPENHCWMDFFFWNHGKKLVSKYSLVNNKSTRTTSRISYIVLVFPLLTLKKYLPAGIFMMKCQDLVCNLVVYVKSGNMCNTFCYIGERKTGKVPEDATLEKKLRKNGTVFL